MQVICNEEQNYMYNNSTGELTQVAQHVSLTVIQKRVMRVKV